LKLLDTKKVAYLIDGSEVDDRDKNCLHQPTQDAPDQQGVGEHQQVMELFDEHHRFTFVLGKKNQFPFSMMLEILPGNFRKRAPED